jgi:hypothetical protein
MERIIQKKMKNFEQTWRIKRLLAEKGETISSLSRKLE